MDQRTDAWFSARLGKVTASRVADILPGRSGYKASRDNYLAEKVVEIMTGETPPSFTSEAMQWGTDTEPMAREAFEAATGLYVDETGFHDHPTIPRFGCSPDGIISGIDPNGGKIITSGLEIKCPNTATHFHTLRTGTWKADYTVQMHVCMMVFETDNWYFASYDPRAPQGLQLFYRKITRDPVLVAQIEIEVARFLADLDLAVNQLEELRK